MRRSQHPNKDIHEASEQTDKGPLLRTDKILPPVFAPSTSSVTDDLR